ncbi:MAG: type IV secretory system conjugative DNA transfer family protein [Chloroflexota bacterium]|nr:type IV secretory system conjugative DNA transfer family protein [Chloroflexota bacterium]
MNLRTKVSPYRCPACGREYAPQEAAARSYFCCGQPLQRMGTGTSLPAIALSEAARETERSADAFLHPEGVERETDILFQGDDDGVVAVEVIPPAGNTVDALALEGLLGSLGLQVPFALEIAADKNGSHFIARARRAVLTHLCSQLENVYGQVEFHPLTEEKDPARQLQVVALIEQFEPDGGRKVAVGRLHLRRFEALPLRTYRDGDFREADPILGVLGGFGRVAEGERLLSQLLLRPAPDDWADGFQSLTRPPDVRIKTESPLGFAGGLLLAGGIGVGLAALLRLVTWAVAGKWLHASLLGLGLLPAGYLAFRAYRSFGRDRLHAEAGQVMRKIFLPGYRFQLRLAVGAPTQEQARRRLLQLASAYRQFNTGAGNALTLEETVFDPCDLDGGWDDGWKSRLRLPGSPRDIINAAEAASLWHLPWGDGAQLVPRVLSLQLLPLPEDVAEGVPIGTSSHHGRTIPVCLPPSAVKRNKLLVARTRRGKTTLMLHLAQAACQIPRAADGREQDDRRGVKRDRARRRAVVFIDPHGDAVKRLVRMVPPERVDDVVYLDFGDEMRVPGWNLLDTQMGFSPELLVESFIYAGRRIWSDYWGPRMEDVLRHVVWTLVRANQARDRAEQYTVFDVQATLILKHFQADMREQIVSDPELMMWWYGYYDKLHERQRLEIVNPVLTKIQRFAASPTVRRIISRPDSTINFLDLVARNGILLVNLPGGSIGLDNTGFLGSLLLSYLEAAIRASQSLPPRQRPRVTCFIDECSSIPFSYQTLLAELMKMGADFTLVAQSLSQLDAIETGLLDTTLANIDTLAVFQTSGRDARELVWELGDEQVKAHHIVNLPDHACFLKTQRDGRPLLVMRVDLLDAPEGDAGIAWAVQERNHRYTVDGAKAERRYREHIEKAYKMDLQKFEEQVAHWRGVANEVTEEAELEEAKRRAEEAMEELRSESEGAGGSAGQPSLFSVGTPTSSPMPEELEKPPRSKHTRSRKKRTNR